MISKTTLNQMKIKNMNQVLEQNTFVIHAHHAPQQPGLANLDEFDYEIPQTPLIENSHTLFDHAHQAPKQLGPMINRQVLITKNDFITQLPNSSDNQIPDQNET